MAEEERHVLIIIGKLNALKSEVERADVFLHENEGNETAQTIAVDGWLTAVESDLDNGNLLGYEARMSEIQTILPA